MWPVLTLLLSHPGTLFFQGGVDGLIVESAVAALLTLAFMATAGRRIMRQSALLAVLIGFAFVPLLMNAIAFFFATFGQSGTDTAGMLVAAALMLSICILPATLATSLLYVVTRREPRIG